MEDIVIVGSGGFAREVRWLIEECNKCENKWNILGWISEQKQGTMIYGLPVLGNDDWLVNVQNKTNAVLGVGDGALRKKLAEKYVQNPYISFPNIVSPNASLGNTSRMGKGCIITEGNIITVDITIGDFFVCNLGCTIGHDCCIGDFVTLFPGAHISGNVTLRDYASIGTGVNIIQGITVGESTIIGAGATVVRDIPSHCTAVGIPAKPLEK